MRIPRPLLLFGAFRFIRGDTLPYFRVGVDEVLYFGPLYNNTCLSTATHIDCLLRMHYRLFVLVGSAIMRVVENFAAATALATAFALTDFSSPPSTLSSACVYRVMVCNSNECSETQRP